MDGLYSCLWGLEVDIFVKRDELRLLFRLYSDFCDGVHKLLVFIELDCARRLLLIPNLFLLSNNVRSRINLLPFIFKTSALVWR